MVSQHFLLHVCSMLTCLTMRCWADTRLSQSLSGGTLLSGCISSGWAFPCSRLCRGSCGVPWASALSSFSQDKCSWLMASSPSTTEAKGDVACLEDMTLLWSRKRRMESRKRNYILRGSSTKHEEECCFLEYFTDDWRLRSSDCVWW